MIKLGPVLYTQLEDAARASPRGRQHYNLHASYDAPCQKLLNALTFDSYIQPHRHIIDPKIECIFALKGRFGCVLFDDNGGPMQNCVIGPNEPQSGIQIEPRQWHTLFALEATGILLEIKDGPFNPNAAKELAPWAIEESDPRAPLYLETLRSLVMCQKPSLAGA